MTLWLRVRRAWHLAAAMLLFCGVHLAFVNIEVRIPSVLGGGSSTISLAIFAPILVAIGLSYSLGSRHRPAERQAAIRLRWKWDLALVSVATALSVVVAFVSAGRSGQTEGLAHLPLNTLIIASLAVFGSVRWSAAVGVSTPTCLILFTMSYAPTNPGASFVRILEPEANLAWALLISATLALAAAGSLLAAE